MLRPAARPQSPRAISKVREECYDRMGFGPMHTALKYQNEAVISCLTSSGESRDDGHSKRARQGSYKYMPKTCLLSRRRALMPGQLHVVNPSKYMPKTCLLSRRRALMPGQLHVVNPSKYMPKTCLPSRRRALMPGQLHVVNPSKYMPKTCLPSRRRALMPGQLHVVNPSKYIGA